MKIKKIFAVVFVLLSSVYIFAQESGKATENDVKTEGTELVDPLSMEIEGCEKTSYGVYYKILKEGTGKAVGNGKTVKVEYVGFLPGGTVFDGSKNFVEGGHDALEFKTGAGQMILGFDFMVKEMKKGEIRKVVLPPELAYPQGIPGLIPAGSYICFYIELL